MIRRISNGGGFIGTVTVYVPRWFERYDMKPSAEVHVFTKNTVDTLSRNPTPFTIVYGLARISHFHTFQASSNSNSTTTWCTTSVEQRTKATLTFTDSDSATSVSVRFTFRLYGRRPTGGYNTASHRYATTLFSIADFIVTRLFLTRNGFICR